jgi:hypothetical protein
MRKLAILALAASPLLMAGQCSSPNTTATTAAMSATISAAATASPKIAKAVVLVDAKIAAASARVSTYCTVMQIGLGGVALFGSSNGAVAAAKIAVNDFCLNPPTDPVSAVTLLEAAYSDLQAQGITAKSLQKLSLTQSRFAAHRLIKLHLDFRNLHSLRG